MSRLHESRATAESLEEEIRCEKSAEQDCLRGKPWTTKAQRALAADALNFTDQPTIQSQQILHLSSRHFTDPSTTQRQCQAIGCTNPSLRPGRLGEMYITSSEHY